MRLDFVRRAEHDVDAAAVGLPARNAGGEMLVGVGDAPVVLFLEFVLYRCPAWDRGAARKLR